MGRWIDEARKRDLDYRDGSVGHVSLHLTSRLWYQPLSKDLVEHAVEKTKIGRDAEKPVKEGDQNWRENGGVVAERREEKRDGQQCHTLCSRGPGGEPLGSVYWIWQLEGH